jgi:hypothetical protein
MVGWFYGWSAQHLGQWHYLLGYLIVLTQHNWPIMLALALGCWLGARLYRRPTRANVCLLYGCALLGAAYEYNKHLAGVLHEAIDFLIGMELIAGNRPAHFVAGPVATALLLVAGLAFMGRGIWLSVREPAAISEAA